jgi:hypothetical protein
MINCATVFEKISVGSLLALLNAIMCALALVMGLIMTLYANL